MPDPCAHVGFGFLAARQVAFITPWQLCTPQSPAEALVIHGLLVVGSNLPDLLDKPLFLMKLCRESEAHETEPRQRNRKHTSKCRSFVNKPGGC